MESCEKKLKRIQDEVGRLKLDDSLLFLNRVLCASRDRNLKFEAAKVTIPVFPHIVHFLTKQLVLHASNLGIRTMTWDDFRRLNEMCVDLDDPIQHDPNWKYADPTTFFLRLFAQQLVPQERNMIQKYGLALGLFRDVGLVEWPKPYDLRSEIEAELGMTLEQFMGMGHVTFALRAAGPPGKKCLGTFTPIMLAEAFQQGITLCTPEVWTPFLERVSCDAERFRRVAESEDYKVHESLFEQFGFNPLRRFPIINVGESRYLAVDPELIVERVTLGLFYDLFERNRTQFTQRFGHAFDQFIGRSLESAFPRDRLWSAAEWEQRAGKREQKIKLSDRAYLGDNLTVLIECKSRRPSLELTTYGNEESIASLANGIAEAVAQLVRHSQDINEGRWDCFGRHKRPTVGVVVTYGKFFTVNGPWARKRIRQILKHKGLQPIQYVVLSFVEWDMVMRLVELGHSLDTLIESLAKDENSFDPLHRYYSEELKECAVSASTLRRGKEFMDGIVTDPVRAA
jgi:hypothetical protein